MQRAFATLGQLTPPQPKADTAVAAIEAPRASLRPPAKKRPKLRVVAKPPLRARAGRQAKAVG
jgi:hypothetical protein